MLYNGVGDPTPNSMQFFLTMYSSKTTAHLICPSHSSTKDPKCFLKSDFLAECFLTDPGKLKWQANFSSFPSN